MKFVDTGAWYAAYVRSDPAHDAVQALIDDSADRLVTTDFVLAEVLNLLRARGEFERAVVIGRHLLSNAAFEMVYLSPADLQKAFIYFSTQPGRAWSFTDCTSLVVMQRKGIKAAIALDRHFRQMPGIIVEP